MKALFSMKTQAAALAAGAAFALGSAAHAQELPGTMVWSSYGPGSTGYAEASAMADAFGREFGTTIRILPSGSAVGRLEPLLRGRADFSFLATEAFFASEGTQDFAARRWGPQGKLRVLAGRPESAGLATAADANIRTLEDMKGKRLAIPAGNPSINVRCNAILSFVGYTLDDVDDVVFPDYSSAARAVAENRADAICTTTAPSVIYELAESPRGLHWVPLPPDNEEGWARLQQVAPIFAPAPATVGANLSEEEPVDMLAYRYPVITALEDTSADKVYAMMKAMDEAYDLYKDTTPVMSRWALDTAATPPIDAPFHEGAIRYLEEKGLWTEEFQAWQEQRLARLHALEAAWEEAVAEGEGTDDDEFAEIWERHRTRALESL